MKANVWQVGWILQPEQLLADTYRISGMIGSPGGMGQVFAADDIRLGLRVAIKVPALHIILTERGVDRFLEEARKAARLRPHPHIVLIHACLTDPALKIAANDARGEVAIPFIVMEYLGGGDLAQRLLQGPVGLGACSDLFAKICSAVHYAHTFGGEEGAPGEHGIIHRDLKPQNICFRKADQPVVVDFGLARLLEDPSTSAGIKGTPTHMAPEQWNPTTYGNVDRRTDIYALGVILFQMVTGQCPFQGDIVEQLLAAHLYEPPPDPRQLRPELPEAVAQAILKALAKKKEERFDSVPEFAQAVTAGLAGSPAQSPAGGPSTGCAISVDSEVEDDLQRCAHCGQAVKPDVIAGKVFCSNCSMPWQREGAARLPPKEEAVAGRPGRDNVRCPYCGTMGSPEVVAGGLFCSECGARLQSHAVITPEGVPITVSGAAVPCPACGSTRRVTLPMGTYCEECGQELRG